MAQPHYQHTKAAVIQVAEDPEVTHAIAPEVAESSIFQAKLALHLLFAFGGRPAEVTGSLSRQ